MGATDAKHAAKGMGRGKKSIGKTETSSHHGTVGQAGRPLTPPETGENSDGWVNV